MAESYSRQAGKLSDKILVDSVTLLAFSSVILAMYFSWFSHIKLIVRNVIMVHKNTNMYITKS